MAEALGIVVKIASPLDMVERKARDKAEAEGREAPCIGTGRGGSVLGDFRHSSRVVSTRLHNIT